MLCAVAAEIGKGGEIHPVGNLTQRETFVVEQFLENGYGIAIDVGSDTVPRQALDGSGKIFGRNVQAPGIVAHVALRATDAGGEQRDELLDDVGGAIGMGVGRFTLARPSVRESGENRRADDGPAVRRDG